MRTFVLMCIGALWISGCVSSEVTECSNGTLCPTGTVCDIQNATCIDPRTPVVVSNLHFSDLPCGGSAEAPLVLSNLGDVPIAFSASTTSDIITIDPAIATIDAGSTFTVTVRVDASGALSMDSIADTIVFKTELYSVPVNVTAELAGALIRTSADIVDFGLASTVVPPNSPRQFTIHNDGNLATEATLVAPASPFGVSDVGPLTIEAGESRTVDVTFDTNIADSYSGEIGVSFSGSVCGTPPDSLALSGLIVANAAVLVDMIAISFGQTGCSVDAATQNILFTNASVVDEQLSFTITGLSADLYSPIEEVVLPAMSTLSIPVVRNAIGVPVIPGAFVATLRVTAAQSSESIDIQLSHAIRAPYIAVTSALSVQYQAPQPSMTQVAISNNGNESATLKMKKESVELKAIKGWASLSPAQFNLAPLSMETLTLQIEGLGEGNDQAVFDFQNEANCNVPQSMTVTITPP